VRDELEGPTAFRLFNNEWDKVHVVETRLPQNAHYEQRSIAEIAHDQQKDPLDVALDLALAEDLQTVFTAVLLNSDTAAVGELLNHPHSLITLSDAGAHLTFFNDAGFGLHLMGYWARDLGVMSLAQAVHQLTARPAKILGLQGRGQIAEGYAADLLLFDPATVGRGPKRRVFDLPGGAPRLDTGALGVAGVWVNGQRVVSPEGLLAKAPLAGELLTSFN
jgi:N-acyl-D-aspartate/D-glutamate deacylase